jgi:hypothetical protein
MSLMVSGPPEGRYGGALAADAPDHVPAFTVNRLCASGLTIVALAAQNNMTLRSASANHGANRIECASRGSLAPRGHFEQDSEK